MMAASLLFLAVLQVANGLAVSARVRVPTVTVPATPRARIPVASFSPLDAILVTGETASKNNRYRIFLDAEEFSSCCLVPVPQA